MTAPAIEVDDSFNLDETPEFSAETLARGTRYATDAEREKLIASLADLPLPETDDEA